MWIYEKKGWPNLTWDMEVLANTLSGIRYRQGSLLGRMEAIGFELKQQASLTTLTSDIVKSSAIEGVYLDHSEVRSSIARRLGIDIGDFAQPGRHVESIVEMMLDATQRYDEPLTKKRLFSWHAALFPTGRNGMTPITVGAWRRVESGPMQVISGPMGQEKVHFEAPPADRLAKEMDDFLRWFNHENKLDPVIKAGVAHLWFVTIHPFDDGNGRIARAIGDMALARADRSNYRFYSISTQIEAERKAYYGQLEMQQKSSTDVTPWLAWFLECLGRAIERSEGALANVLFKAELWSKVGKSSLNARQRQVINRMCEDDFKGYINSSKYAKLAKCSTDTALRDIMGLVTCGLLIKNPGGGRSTSYRLAEKS